MLKQQYSDKTIEFVGDGIPSKSTNCYLDVENLGLAGYKKFINTHNTSEELLPLYLKKPQAQRQLEAKLKENI